MTGAHGLRKALDGLFLGAGILAAMFLVLIGIFVLSQVVARLLGTSVPGADQFAGHSLSASSFLALAYTLRHNGHIRVSLVIERLTGRLRRGAEIWCLAVATGVTAYFAYYSVYMVWESYVFQSHTIGLNPILLWIPQTGMGIGTTLLALAFLEELVRVVAGQPATYQLATDPLGDVIEKDTSGDAAAGRTGQGR